MLHPSCLCTGPTAQSIHVHACRSSACTAHVCLWSHVTPGALCVHACRAPALPKTRSGKLMRRVLKKIALGELSRAWTGFESQSSICFFNCRQREAPSDQQPALPYTTYLLVCMHDFCMRLRMCRRGGRAGGCVDDRRPLCSRPAGGPAGQVGRTAGMKYSSTYMLCSTSVHAL